MNRKLLIIAAIVFVIIIGIAYLGYQYYLGTQKIAPEQGIEKIELPQEEVKKIIERNLPEPNTKELSEEEKQKILKHQQ